MTKQNGKSAEVEALLREREGYVRRGRADRVAQVEAAIAALGFAVTDEPLATDEPTVEPQADAVEVETAEATPVDVETAAAGKKRKG